MLLDLRFIKPQFEKQTEQRLENVIETLPKSQMEKVGREYAKGFMNLIKKCVDQQLTTGLL